MRMFIIRILELVSTAFVMAQLWGWFIANEDKVNNVMQSICKALEPGTLNSYDYKIIKEHIHNIITDYEHKIALNSDAEHKIDDSLNSEQSGGLFDRWHRDGW